MNAAWTKFPLYVSFDPVQVTILEAQPHPILRLSYLVDGYHQPYEANRDLELSPDTLSRLIEFMEHLPEKNFHGSIYFPRERLALRFCRRQQSNNRYLDVIRGQLCKRFLSIDVPLRKLKVRVESFQILLTGLKSLNGNRVVA